MGQPRVRQRNGGAARNEQRQRHDYQKGHDRKDPRVLPQGQAATTLDLSLTVQDLAPALNAAKVAEIEALTEAEIYELLDEWAQRLARRVGLFTAASITAPEVFRQYFFSAVLGEARRQETDEGMPLFLDT